MRVKPAIVILMASLMVGGAIVMTAVLMMKGETEPADTARAPRSNPFVAEVETALKNAATAQESFATSSGGLYTVEVRELEEEGLQPTEYVTISVVHASELGYCIEGAHARLANKMWHYSSDGGQPVPGICRLTWE